uniref:Protein kinase domain-containing protein n=1 Tax=Romanomermis culicivorax TaxID=13658 RepID=A0A915I6K1_ROMCU
MTNDCSRFMYNFSLYLRSATRIMQQLPGGHCYTTYVSISDFGMCQVCWSDKYPCTKDDFQNHGNLKFPVRWMAPEMLPQFGRMANNRSDVWSYGVVLWETAHLGSRLPYEQYNIFDVEMAHVKLVVENYRLEKPDNCNSGHSIG